MNKKNVALGYLGPPILTFLLIHLFDYLDIRVFEYLSVNFLNKYTVGINIANYSLYPQFFSATLLVSLALIPLLILNGWLMADAKNPKGIFHILSPYKSVLLLIILAMLPILLWSIPVEPEDLENIERKSVVNIYSNSFLFYLNFLLPIYFLSSLTAAFIKTLIELKFKK